MPSRDTTMKRRGIKSRRRLRSSLPTTTTRTVPRLPKFARRPNSLVVSSARTTEKLSPRYSPHLRRRHRNPYWPSSHILFGYSYFEADLNGNFANKLDVDVDIFYVFLYHDHSFVTASSASSTSTSN
ncbi:hypothetical protein A4X13_0g7771 [Tilletia indica]|uniref:Uncharacterized protein n=1 Tax=Tilletia indica TaxID=43049 RepID=A0A8T8SIT3_9BASI|nr:hypothetical protein A4X13_0g7771 [Tilletia indica]